MQEFCACACRTWEGCDRPPPCQPCRCQPCRSPAQRLAARSKEGSVSHCRLSPSCCLEIPTAPKRQRAPAVCGRSTAALPPQPKWHPLSSAVPPAPEKHDPRGTKKNQQKKPKTKQKANPTLFNRRGEDSQSSRNPRGSLCCC